MTQNLKKKTNFSIDCILSKTEVNHTTIPMMPLNKVPDNPWIPRSPLSMTFNPGIYRKLHILPPSPTEAPISPLTSTYFDNFYGTSMGCYDNLVKIRNNYSSVNNHFYLSAPNANVPSTTSASNNRNSPPQLPAVQSHKLHHHSLSPKTAVYENREPCDSDNLRSLSLNEIKLSKLGNFKCVTCFKAFESAELLEVSDWFCMQVIKSSRFCSPS